MNTARIIAVTEPVLHNGGTIIYDESGFEVGYSEGEKLSVDQFIAYVARVSNPSNQNNTLTATKLLRYLAKHKHWSPFEMVNIVMEIETTRDIARQILRHRSFSFQEFSQRYADPTKDLKFVTRSGRRQDTQNRQNSIELDLTNDADRFLAAGWENIQREVIRKCRDAYEFAIQNGIAKFHFVSFN